MDITTDQLKAVGERAVKTTAQALLAYVLAGEATSFFEVDWQGGAGVALLAGVLSIITSLASWSFGPEGPSLAGEVPADEYLRVDNAFRTLDQEAEIDRILREEDEK